MEPTLIAPATLTLPKAVFPVTPNVPPIVALLLTVRAAAVTLPLPLRVVP